MARIGVTLALEQIESASQAIEHLFGTKDGGACRSQLQREWELVETRTQLGHGATGNERGINAPSSGDKQRLPVIWAKQRHRVRLLATNPEPLPARYHHFQRGARRQKRNEL